MAHQMLHMAWKGIPGDSGIYHATGFPDVHGAMVWNPQQNVRGVGTTHSPTLTAFRNEIRMAWKGIEGDSGIYFDSSFGPQERVPGVGTTHGPALASQLNQFIRMAWKGISGDSGLYTTANQLFSQGWEPQRNVRGVGTSDKPALAFSFPNLFMAWKGIPG